MPSVKIVAVLMSAGLLLLILFGFVLPTLFSAASNESVLLAVVMLMGTILAVYFAISKIVSQKIQKRRIKL